MRPASRWVAGVAFATAPLAGGCGASVEPPPPPPATPPAITRILPESVSARYGAFTLTVEGDGFRPTAVVQWDGASRPTLVESATRAVASIPAEDAVRARRVQISVRNPSPDSGTSYPAPFSVVAPAVTRQVALPLAGQDIVYDPRRDVLYASVGSQVFPDVGRLVVIDPRSGGVVSSTVVGPGPGPLALSDDGQFLYVVVNGASLVKRFDLVSGAPAVDIPLGSEAPDRPYGADDIVVLEGAPRSFAVARKHVGLFVGSVDVAVFDGEVQRPLTSAVGCDRIERSGDPALLYGYQSHNSGGGFHWLAIRPDGVVQSRVAYDLLPRYASDIIWYGGRLYATDGTVVDPEARTVIARLSGVEPRTAVPDSLSGRLFFLSLFANTDWGSLTAFDLRTLDVIDGVTVVPASSYEYAYPRALRRWGDDGLAYVTGRDVVLLQTTLVRPRSYGAAPGRTAARTASRSGVPPGSPASRRQKPGEAVER